MTAAGTGELQNMIGFLASVALTLAFAGSAAAAPPTQPPRVMHLSTSTMNDRVTYTSKATRPTCPKGQHVVVQTSKLNEKSVTRDICKR